MKLGVFIYLSAGTDMEAEFRKLVEHDFSSCQINIWNEALLTDETADHLRETARRYGVEISALWCGWGGPSVWNFREGPLTLGLVPADLRADRMKTLKKGSDFARRMGVRQMITHVGFIPENPVDPVYAEVVEAVRELARYCKGNGQAFLFETGQETPVTLKRTIDDVGMDNVGVNLDPANLILYGKGNPVDALEVLGPYVRDVHAKDGLYPTDGYRLGAETPIGEGRVDFPALIAGLRACGYDGPLTIEREISGEEQTRDILRARDYLLTLIQAGGEGVL